MSKGEEYEPSAFTSRGVEGFPPIYPDTQLISEFSTWSTKVLEERLKTYLTFLKKDNVMPRARDGASRLVDHIIFELLYRERAETVDVEYDDCPTGEIDINTLKRMLDEPE